MTDKKRSDFWLWDGAVEYEGSLVKLDEGSFTAHVREARTGSGRATGRRLPLPHVELQRRFTGRRFLSYFKDCAEATFEVEIDAVQRSSVREFDYFVCGRFRTSENQPDAAGKIPTRADAKKSTKMWL